jgi:hypothetical protein
VKTCPGQKPYWANEVTGATSWAQPPPDVQYHKPLPKQSMITSYGFVRQPREDPKDDVDTAVFYDSPLLPSLPPLPTKKSTLEITVNVNTKMNLGVEKGLLNHANDLGVSAKHPDSTRLQKPELASALKSHLKTLHHEEMTHIHDYLCYQAPPQNIDHKREGKVDNTQISVATTVADDQLMKRHRKRIPLPSIVVSITFKNRGFFLDMIDILKCQCNNKSKGKMYEAGLKVHLKIPLRNIEPYYRRPKATWYSDYVE